MNNKDREHIGYLLSSCQDFENFKSKLFCYDKKIETEYDSFEYVSGRDSDVDELYTKIMIERYGHKWSLLKEAPPSGQILEEAQRQIYGDDYEFIFKQ